ncbi:hypothetical protein GF371_04355 [Candidatus Woesearchaeota archaeon]|nr:hypothetical protein [Candidatus Woesearchaeota archaeon]
MKPNNTNPNKKNALVLEDVMNGLKEEYEKNTEAGKTEPVQYPGLTVEQNGDSITVSIPEMTFTQRIAAMNDIDKDIASIRQERECLFPNAFPRFPTYQRRKVIVGKGHFAHPQEAIAITKDIAPAEELEATARRIEENICYYEDALQGEDDGILSLPYTNHILSDEWKTFEDFRAMSENDDYARSKDKFHKCLENIDMLLDNDLGICALEIYAVMRRVHMDPEASKYLKRGFGLHLYHAGERIYKDFLKNTQDYQELTAWQYEALLDAATQHLYDKAEDAFNSRTKATGDIQEIHRKMKELEDSSERAEKARKEEEKRKLQLAHQDVFNCISNHYSAKLQEEIAESDREEVMESVSNA